MEQLPQLRRRPLGVCEGALQRGRGVSHPPLEHPHEAMPEAALPEPPQRSRRDGHGEPVHEDQAAASVGIGAREAADDRRAEGVADAPGGRHLRRVHDGDEPLRVRGHGPERGLLRGADSREVRGDDAVPLGEPLPDGAPVHLGPAPPAVHEKEGLSAPADEDVGRPPRDVENGFADGGHRTPGMLGPCRRRNPEHRGATRHGTASRMRSGSGPQGRGIPRVGTEGTAAIAGTPLALLEPVSAHSLRSPRRAFALAASLLLACGGADGGAPTTGDAGDSGSAWMQGTAEAGHRTRRPERRGTSSWGTTPVPPGRRLSPAAGRRRLGRPHRARSPRGPRLEGAARLREGEDRRRRRPVGQRVQGREGEPLRRPLGDGARGVGGEGRTGRHRRLRLLLEPRRQLHRGEVRRLGGLHVGAPLVLHGRHGVRAGRHPEHERVVGGAHAAHGQQRAAAVRLGGRGAARAPPRSSATPTRAGPRPTCSSTSRC